MTHPDAPDIHAPAMGSRRLLMVAFHFPPMAGSSGIQRTLNFARDLLPLGWTAAVLTAHRRAYSQTSDHHLSDIPPEVVVRPAFALDSARHLSIRGRYPMFLALPDRWISWLLGGVASGLAMIRQLRPAVLWSTYPIATAHLIGYALARISGLPWIADFRDPMAHEGYPTDRRTWQSFLRVEQRVFSRAWRIVFATPGAAALYRKRYPQTAERIRVIENGYDEKAFALAEQTMVVGPLNPACITLLHSGIVYPEWRSPDQFFRAIRNLLDAGAVGAAHLRVRFRAPQHDAFVQDLVRDHGLEQVVEILPHVAYRQALTEMLRSDALVAIQSSGCNDQIPAKLYEYFRARRPIIGLTDPVGDTAGALRAAGYTHIAPLDSVSAIQETLAAFIADIAAGTAPVAPPAIIAAASRHERARALAQILQEAPP